MVMSSRSILWTLTQQRPPAPSDEICQKLAQKLREGVPKGDPKYDDLTNVLGVGGPRPLFKDDPRVLGLKASAPDEGKDPLLTALDRLEWVDDERQRRGAAPVRQRITPGFVEAALSQWARDDEGIRVDLLRKSDILDRLVEKGFLTGAMRRQLRRESGRRPRPIIPPDFCDDGKNGLDLDLRPELHNARKVCYGIFRREFPDSALDATNPELWHDRCPRFWLRSDVLAKADAHNDEYDYQAGFLEEEVDLPNLPNPFGPVRLTFERTTAKDRSWSFVTYKLADQTAMRVNEGWYLVQRCPGRPHAAIMVKVVEFDGINAWLDSVCETGLMDGARALLGVDQGPAGRSARSGPAPGAGQDGPLTGVLSDYLDGRSNGWEHLATAGLDEMKHGVAEFEANPLRFGWVDNVFGVIDQSTTFLSEAVSDWVDVIRHNLPDALAQADESAAARASTAGGEASTAGGPAGSPPTGR